MRVIHTYNSLNGEIKTREEIQHIINLAKSQGQNHIANKLQNVLDQNEDNIFEFELVRKEIEAAELGMLAGLEFLSEPEEEPGLGKPVSPDEIYQMITDMVVNTIETKGHLPWERGWKDSGLAKGKEARNYDTQKPYRGINFFLLNFKQGIDKEGNRFLEVIDYENPNFLTFNSIKKHGGKLKKGSKGHRVIYFTRLYRVQWEEKGEQKEFGSYDPKKVVRFLKSNPHVWKYINSRFIGGFGEITIEGYVQQNVIPILKYYNVFNGADVEGIEFDLEEGRTENKTDEEKIEVCEAIVSSYPNPPKLEFKGDQPAYYPMEDTVLMTPIDQFDNPQFYYSTLFHELAHSTGHSKRLDRGNDTRKRDGSKEDRKAYDFEELVAEMTAVFLCAESGILFKTLERSAAYLKHYRDRLIQLMKEDNRFFFRAASRSQAASDHILDRDKNGQPAYLKNLPKEKEKPEPKKTDKPEQEKEEDKKPSKSRINEAIELAERLGDEEELNIDGEYWYRFSVSEWEKSEKHRIYLNLKYGRNAGSRWRRGVSYYIDLKDDYSIHESGREYSNAREKGIVKGIAEEVAEFLKNPDPKPEKPSKPIDLEIKKPTKKQPKNEFKDGEIIAMWKTRGDDFIEVRKSSNSFVVITKFSNRSENTIEEAFKAVDETIELAKKYDGKNYREVYNKHNPSPLKNNFFTEKYKVNVEDIVKMLNAQMIFEIIESVYGISKEVLESEEFIGDLLVANANEKAGLTIAGAYGFGKLPLEHLKISSRRIQKKSPVKALTRIAGKDEEKKNMTGVYVDEEGYVATDAHVLSFIPAKVKKDEIGKIINVNPKFSGTKGKYVDAKFPNWRAVIPEWNSKEETKWFDLQKLVNKVNAIVSALSKAKKYSPYIALNNTKYVNPFLLLDLLLVLAEAGEKKVKIYSQKSLHRAIVLKTENDIKGLIMPIYLGDDDNSAANIEILPDYAESLAAPHSGTNKQEFILFKKKEIPKRLGKTRKTLGKSRKIRKSTESSEKLTKRNQGLSAPNVRSINSQVERAPDFAIAGETKKFLQSVEKKPVGSVVVTLDGPQGAGKTTSLFQFLNDFAEAGNSCLFASLEEHPASNLFNEKRDQYLSEEAQNLIDVTDEFENVDEFYKVIKHYDCIFIDSWQKLIRMIGRIRLDEDLRRKFDGKVFFIIFQQTTTGRTKGGAEIVFDGDIIIKLQKEPSFKDNYAYFDKNRYTKVPIENIRYNVLKGFTYNPNDQIEEEEQENEEIEAPKNIAGGILNAPVVY